jgi:hypothetical protein
MTSEARGRWPASHGWGKRWRGACSDVRSCVERPPPSGARLNWRTIAPPSRTANAPAIRPLANIAVTLIHRLAPARRAAPGARSTRPGTGRAAGVRPCAVTPTRTAIPSSATTNVAIACVAASAVRVASSTRSRNRRRQRPRRPGTMTDPITAAFRFRPGFRSIAERGERYAGALLADGLAETTRPWPRVSAAFGQRRPLAFGGAAAGTAAARTC